MIFGSPQRGCQIHQVRIENMTDEAILVFGNFIFGGTKVRMWAFQWTKMVDIFSFRCFWVMSDVVSRAKRKRCTVYMCIYIYIYIYICILGTQRKPLFWLEVRPCFGRLLTFKNRGKIGALGFFTAFFLGSRSFPMRELNTLNRSVGVLSFFGFQRSRHLDPQTPPTPKWLKPQEIDSRDIRKGVPRSRTCTLTVFIGVHLGILGDEKTHKYPRAIGLVWGFHMTGYVGRISSICLFRFSSNGFPPDRLMAPRFTATLKGFSW